jgi:UDP-N-acetylmuramate--alanine ligase
MKQSPFFINKIHFVGIGGIGMSGIAEILHHLGYSVQGSDQAEGYNTNRLQQVGIQVHIGHAAENIENVDVVVISSAVSEKNPEIIEARKRRIPVVHRSEMLAELMRLKWSIAVGGSHGKTTTTSLLAMLLKKAQCGPTVVSGGIINELKTNAELGLGNMMVVEADESDGSFQRLPATMTIVTNIDPEHMPHYKTLDRLKAAFVNFIENTPFYGLNVLCGDDKNIQSIIPLLGNKRIITYGFNEDNDVRATNVRCNSHASVVDVEFSERAQTMLGNGSTIQDLKIIIHGKHNILNSLSTVCIAREMDIPDEVIRNAFLSFEGVKRRFTITGTVNDVMFVDDYAHHPTEIQAVVQGAETLKKGKLILVIQPHRYSRMQDHFEDFVRILTEAKSVDQIYLLPLYAAGEEPIPGYESQDLAKKLLQNNIAVKCVSDQAELQENLFELLSPEDIVIFMGAGNITQMAYDAPTNFKAYALNKA